MEPCQVFEAASQAEQDTQECANFLLALKHLCSPSTPDPPSKETQSSSSPKSGKKTTKAKKRKRSYDSDDSKAPSLSDEQHHSPSSPSMTDSEIQSLLGDSTLVQMQDRHLIPDSLFIVMAQMKACSLTKADQVGCYKNRDIGFRGMCCKHCRGQPGFGRFFPTTVRSLSQTTTAQTILKHISSKCRYCPDDIRQAILDLQLKQATQEASDNSSSSTSASNNGAGRPRYGSRKVFFQRIWSRVHNEQQGRENSSEGESLTTSAKDELLVEASHHQRFLLPIEKKKKKRKVTDDGYASNKRVRVNNE